MTRRIWATRKGVTSICQLLESAFLAPELDLVDITPSPNRGDRCGSVVIPFVGTIEAPVLVEEAAQIRETKLVMSMPTVKTQ